MPYFSRFFVFVFIASLFLAAPHAGAGEDKAFARVMKTGELNCGTYVYNNIFTFTDDIQKAQGFAVDLMNEVAKRLEIKIKWTEMANIAFVFEELKQGRYDMLCAPIGVDPGLYKKALYGPALFYDTLYVYGDAKKDWGNIHSLAELNNPQYRFGGMDGEFGGRYVPKTFPKAKLTMLPQGSPFGQMMTELQTGKIDFLVLSNFGFQAYEATNPGKIKRVDTDPILWMPIRNGFAEDSLKLHALYSAVIEDLRFDGTLEKLIEKYGLTKQ